MAENLKAPTQEITPETRFSVRQRFFALIGAGALLVGATACGADEKVGATPSPVETSTSQSTDPTEAPTKGPTTPAETTPVTSAPEKNEGDEVFRIPTFRDDGNPWDGVNETALEIEGLMSQEAGDSAVMQSILRFADRNSSDLELFANGPDGLIRRNPFLNGGDPEDNLAIAKQDLAVRTTMYRLGMSSTPGSPERAIYEAWKKLYFADGMENASFYVEYISDATQSDNSKLAAEGMQAFEQSFEKNPETVVAMTPFSMDSGGHLTATYTTIDFGGWSDKAVVDTSTFSTYQIEITDMGAAVLRNKENALFAQIYEGKFSVSQFPGVEKYLGLTIQKAKELAAQQP